MKRKPPLLPETLKDEEKAESPFAVKDPHPLDLTPETLPEVIPVFPLPSVILLPHCQLPLNLYERRYIKMALDSLGKDRLIGMVQPVHQEMEERSETLYPIGCAGRIINFEETPDKRLQITLKGISRFQIKQELHGDLPYRRVEADWGPFGEDFIVPQEAGLDKTGLLTALARYSRHFALEIDQEPLHSVPVSMLVNILSVSLPFETVDKQALLEAKDVGDRLPLLLGLMQMAVLAEEGGGGTKH